MGSRPGGFPRRAADRAPREPGRPREQVSSAIVLSHESFQIKPLPDRGPGTVGDSAARNRVSGPLGSRRLRPRTRVGWFPGAVPARRSHENSLNRRAGRDGSGNVIPILFAGRQYGRGATELCGQGAGRPSRWRYDAASPDNENLRTGDGKHQCREVERARPAIRRRFVDCQYSERSEPFTGVSKRILPFEALLK